MFQKQIACHSFLALNKASDVLAPFGVLHTDGFALTSL